MTQWNDKDAASNAVSWAVTTLGLARNANAVALFNNTTPGAFVSHQAVGIFGVSAAEVANTQGEGYKAKRPGWVLRREFTGPVVSFSIGAGGTGYSNTDVIKVSGGNTVSNATGIMTTNSTGGIVTATVNAPGEFLNSGGITLSFANSLGGASSGSGATVTPVLGRKAGRVQYESLVAMNINGASSATDNTVLPG